MAVPRRLDPLQYQMPIVKPDTGVPSEYFMRLWNAAFNTGNDVGSLLGVDLVAGSGLTGGGSLGDLIDITFAIDVEFVQDLVGAMLDDTATIDLTYTDGTGKIKADLKDTAVTPGTYGDASHYPVIVVDQQGRITDASNQAVSSGSGNLFYQDTGVLAITKPTAAGFTLVQNTNLAGAGAVGDLSTRGVYVYCPATSAGGANVAQIQQSPGSTNFTVITQIHVDALLTDNWGWGIGVEDSGGKIQVFGFRNGTAVPWAMWVGNWTDKNTFSSNQARIDAGQSNIAPVWLKLTKTGGTTFDFYISWDGEHFQKVYTGSSTVFLGATVSKVGIFIDNQSAQGAGLRDFYLNVFSWTNT